ncbi:Acylphosphatase [Viridothelium virens]|uniref:Acylphosphatase n=1 Tax=Viridothelium virens TaxID=1048519 RepID=A0A6A6H4N9_VIRVR|nr:Acylphosphatase [Viridothelium virens]
MAPKRIQYKVEGQVQGVNFRSYTRRQAQGLGVTGFVKNVEDGSVQGEAQGTDEQLKEFIQHLNKGPQAAIVNGVEHSEIETKEGESSFSD